MPCIDSVIYRYHASNAIWPIECQWLQPDIVWRAVLTDSFWTGCDVCIPAVHVHCYWLASSGVPRNRKLSNISSLSSSGAAVRSTRSIKLKSKDHGTTARRWSIALRPFPLSISLSCQSYISGSRSHKSSGGAATPSVAVEIAAADEGPATYDDRHLQPDDIDIYSELCEDLHTKLHWLPVSCHFLSILLLSSLQSRPLACSYWAPWLIVDPDSTVQRVQLHLWSHRRLSPVLLQEADPEL